MKKKGIVLRSVRNFISPSALNTESSGIYLGVSGSLLRKLREEGIGPRFCRIGTRVVYRVSDLDEFLEKSTC